MPDSANLEWLQGVLAKYENKPSDGHRWGLVESVAADGSYNVRLNSSSVLTKCSAGCTASVGDVVFVVIKTDGECVAVSRLGGEGNGIDFPLSVDKGGTGVTSDAAIGLKAYPVGAVYISYTSTSPAQLFGGTWTQITDRFLRAANDTATGGSDTHTLTTAQMPSHTHNMALYSNDSGSSTLPTWIMWIGARWSTGGAVRAHDSSSKTTGYNFTTFGPTAATGGGGSHNNMPAYQDVYVWRRTA